MAYDQSVDAGEAYNMVPELMVAFEMAMDETFLGQEDNAVSAITAQIAAAGLDEAPEVLRKPSLTIRHPVHENENPLCERGTERCVS